MSVNRKKPAVKPRFLVVGLGNPGIEYENTRHNVGFLVVGALAKKLKATFVHLNKADVAEIYLDQLQLILAKPLTFMNLSGQAVAFLLKYFQLEPQNLLVIHDDLDLPLAALRIKTRGGTGGHLGLKSVIESVKTDRFLRVRIGIGRPSGKKDPAAFVLEPFSTKEEEQIKVTVELAADAVIDIVTKGAAYAMNKYNKSNVAAKGQPGGFNL